MRDLRDIQRDLMEARDALNGAIRGVADGDAFSAGAYTRNAHKILDDMLGGD